MNVLIEKPGFGRSENFAGVLCDDNLPSGTIVTLAVTGHDGTALQGVAL